MECWSDRIIITRIVHDSITPPHLLATAQTNHSHHTNRSISSASSMKNQSSEKP
jgi:hypothetical protein